MNVEKYWHAVLNQSPEAMKVYFHEDSLIRWHNTDECFTVDEFITANCVYPGNWAGEIQRIEQLPSLTITVVHVYSKDQKLSFHVTSFIQLKEDKIAGIDEYWSFDEDAPDWRKKLKLSKPIKFNKRNS